MTHSISFFFPYHEVSGCPVLFLNIARLISKSSDWEVNIVDYSDGYMASSLFVDDKIKLIEFVDRKNCYVGTEYLVMQSYLADAIRPELKIAPKTKVFFWMLHPMNYMPIVFPFNFFHGFIEKHWDSYARMLRIFYPASLGLAKGFYEYTTLNGMSAIMNNSDMPVLRTMLNIRDFNRYEPTVIPIAASNPELRKINFRKDVLRLGWVGRLCDFKITILNYTIKSAREYADNNKIQIYFHVIGDGDLAYLLDTRCSDFFTVIPVGSIPKENLDKYIVENIDINFAMGTSIIESAKLAVPSVKLDFTYGDIPDGFVFRWFYKSSEYDIGHVLLDSELEPDNNSFELIIEEYLKDTISISNKSYEHYYSQFSLKSVTQKIINALLRISITWGDVPLKYKKRSLSRKIYYRLKYHL